MNDPSLIPVTVTCLPSPLSHSAVDVWNAVVDVEKISEEGDTMATS